MYWYCTGSVQEGGGASIYGSRKMRPYSSEVLLLTTIVTKLVLRMRTCSFDPIPFKYNEVSSYLHHSTFLPTQKIITCKYSSKYRISIEKLRTGNFLKNNSQKKIEFQPNSFLLLLEFCFRNKDNT